MKDYENLANFKTTQGLLKDVPLHVISSMLGHYKLNTTQIYLDSLPTNILDKYHKQLILD